MELRSQPVFNALVKQSREHASLKRPSPTKERCSLSSSAREETLESTNSSKKRKTSKATIGSSSREEGPSGVVQTSNRLNNTITITETLTYSTNESTNAEDMTSTIQAANVPQESLASPVASNDPIECGMQILDVLKHEIIATQTLTAIPGDSAKDVPVTEKTPVLSNQSSVPGIALDSTTAVKLSPMVKTTRSCKTACQSDVRVDSRNQTNVASPADPSAHHACRLPIFYNSSASPQREPCSDENLFEPRFEVNESPQITKTAMNSAFDGDESGAALDLMLQIMQYEQEEAKLNREEAELKLQITQHSREEVTCKLREAKMKLEMLTKKRERPSVSFRDSRDYKH
ncbi:hypothetical protein E8E13_011070 [Curvularia kusanoi]|uniref:Uncharacterized protein n=1 Tax=Curvularia kusanoi TaxID=90978 RepID=A0A9P4WDN1_CURKU|nr:hypothetical protein E8E13_011070 [Curvularia kusanoi]